jgi:adenosylcobinamide-GDP ribazoletransferase
LLTKVLLLGLLVQAGGALQAALAVFAAHVTSRFMPLLVIRSLPHVGDTASSKSKPLADSIGTLGLLAGLLWCLPALVLAGWWAPGLPWLPAVLGALVGTAWMWRLLRQRLQGFTGDGLGATQQLSELLFYLGLALAL